MTARKGRPAGLRLSPWPERAGNIVGWSLMVPVVMVLFAIGVAGMAGVFWLVGHVLGKLP